MYLLSEVIFWLVGIYVKFRGVSLLKGACLPKSMRLKDNLTKHTDICEP